MADEENSTNQEDLSAMPLPIEILIQKHGIRPWIAAGLMAERKWASGKQLTKAEFAAAVEVYLKSPMAGQPDKKE